MLESNKENLDLNTIGHYKKCSGLCSCIKEKESLELGIDHKCKLIINLIEIYSRFEHLYNEAYLRIAFFGSMSYPIAKNIYNLITYNHDMKLSINIFEENLELCSHMLKKNIEEELKIGIFNFEPHNTHSNNHAYNIVVCSDMLFTKENKAEIFNEFCRIMINGCFIIITDIFKKEGSDTKDLEESLGIPPLVSLETLRENLLDTDYVDKEIFIVNSMDYTKDLEKHLKIIEKKPLLENIHNLVYNVVVFKIS